MRHLQIEYYNVKENLVCLLYQQANTALFVKQSIEYELLKALKMNN